jgi:hypothetical protein
MVKTTSGWVFMGYFIAADTPYYIRAAGYSPAGIGGRIGLIENTARVD